jgi:hypothetical protein
MRLDSTPAVNPVVARALLDVLADRSLEAAPAYAAPWRKAALQEGVEREEGSGEPVAYAFSPRSTRGATRA